MPFVEGQPLRILHATRAPVGGIIRHILDLANGQAERGHHVGIIADSLTGGERADRALAEIAPRMKLGVHRFAIRREPSPFDLVTWLRFTGMVRRLKPDVLHGHGAKAGAFLRMRGASTDSIRVYTPHGGSLHYPLSTLKGQLYSRLERGLMNRTELFLFESAFARDTYQRMIGKPSGLVKRVFNGVTAGEFDPVELAEDATDICYVGEFRRIKLWLHANSYMGRTEKAAENPEKLRVTTMSHAMEPADAEAGANVTELVPVAGGPSSCPNETLPPVPTCAWTREPPPVPATSPAELEVDGSVSG